MTHGKEQILFFMNELSNLATFKLNAKLDELKINTLTATEYLDDESKLKVSISHKRQVEN